MTHKYQIYKKDENNSTQKTKEHKLNNKASPCKCAFMYMCIYKKICLPM